MRKEALEQVVFGGGALNFSSKLEMARQLNAICGKDRSYENMKAVLEEIDQFRLTRNKIIHGTDVTPIDARNENRIQSVTRSGKQKTVVISMDSHSKQMEECDQLRERLQRVAAARLKELAETE